MPTGLVRYQQTGHSHFITFSCYQRRPYLQSEIARNLFEQSLEKMRLRYHFYIFGYVVMPEHVHLLLSEPRQALLSKAIQALKLSMSVRSTERPFWHDRYYDFNIFTNEKRTEKLRYIHRNPLHRGLVEQPADWPWSSFRHYATGEQTTIEIESEWAAARRDQSANKGFSTKRIRVPHVSILRHGMDHHKVPRFNSPTASPPAPPPSPPPSPS